MKASKKVSKSAARPAVESAALPLAKQLKAALAALERSSTRGNRDGLARYGIIAQNALGVPMGDIQRLGKQLGKNHELALALWDTNCYEARLLTAFVADPERLTPAQMERWCRDFDNWAVCDTLCFHLFDRTPHAWSKLRKWSGAREEFVKRSAFALLASIAGHDKQASDDLFLASLPLIERAASDARNFVKKGVSWALRRVGRRSRALHAASLALSSRLAASSDASERWVGRDALKDLHSAAVSKGLDKIEPAAAKRAKPTPSVNRPKR